MANQEPDTSAGDQHATDANTPADRGDGDAPRYDPAAETACAVDEGEQGPDGVARALARPQAADDGSEGGDDE